MKRLITTPFVRRLLSLFFFISLISFQHRLLAQSDETLSLGQKLTLSDSIKLSDHAQFIDILTDIESNKDQLNPAQKSKFLYLKAFKLAYDNKRDLAIRLYKQVYETAQDSVIQQRALSSLIYNYGFLHEWENGLNYIEILAPQLPTIVDLNERIRAYESLINFYNKIGEFELAAQHLQSLFRLKLDEKQQCIASMLEVEALLGMGNLKNQLSSITARAQQCELADVQLAAANIRLYFSEFLIAEGQSNEAIFLLNEQLGYAESSAYAPLIASYYGALAQAYLNQNNQVKSKFYALEIVNDLQYRQFTPPLITAYSTLQKIAVEEENFRSAYTYLKTYENLNTIQLEAERRKNLAIQQAKNNAIKAANQIALLDKQNTLLKTQAALAKEQADNDRMALGLAISFVLIMIGWLYRNRKTQHELRRLAEIDGLTGVSNRYHFNKVAKTKLENAEKNYEACAFILFDLDHFKSINDNFGHQIGDWALQRAVVATRSVCREHDIIGRMGGEEFAILLKGCDISKALQIAEMCRDAMQKIDTIESGHRFRINASFGVSDAKSCGYNVDKLFAGADLAMYRSKHAGRNRVYRYDNDQRPITI